jgi:hypothetical protein
MRLKKYNKKKRSKTSSNKKSGDQISNKNKLKSNVEGLN